MATPTPGPHLERALAWMDEVGAEQALADRDADRLTQTARHAAVVVERDALVAGPLWEEAGDRLLLDAWLAAHGVGREALDGWASDDPPSSREG